MRLHATTLCRATYGGRAPNSVANPPSPQAWAGFPRRGAEASCEPSRTSPVPATGPSSRRVRRVLSNSYCPLNATSPTNIQSPLNPGQPACAGAARSRPRRAVPGTPGDGRSGRRCVVSAFGRSSCVAGGIDDAGRQWCRAVEHGSSGPPGHNKAIATQDR
jgi:hypothetical protein